MRFLKWLLTLVALLAVLAIGGAFTLRYLQGTFDAPRNIAGTEGVAAIANMGAQMYAAKVGDGHAILFDTGIDPSGAPVAKLLRELGSSRRLTHAFVTHGHFDHVASVNELQSEGVKVYAGAADAELIAQSKPADKLPAKIMLKVLRTSPSKPDELLDGRREIDVGGETVTAIPLPGHTAGTYLYFHRGVLYTGDAILFEDGKLTSGLDFFNEDTKRNRASIAALDLAGLEVKTICTGHTGCTPQGSAKDLLAALLADCAKNP